MGGRHRDLDYFIHAFSSPLTALHGAVALLRRRLADSNPLLTTDLLTMIERNTTRLHSASELLMQHATTENGYVVVRVPAALFHPNDSVGPPAPVASPAALAEVTPPTVAAPVAEPAPALPPPGGVALLFSDDAAYAEQLRTLCAGGDFSLHHVASPTAAVDSVRRHSPALVLIDMAHAQEPLLVAQVLSEDPDTKRVPMLLLYESSVRETLPLTTLPTLPRATPADAFLAALRETVALGQSRNPAQPRVLLVDDEADMRQLVAIHLEEAGFQVAMAGGGAEALQLVQRQPVDLIILDLMLPDLDGFVVLGGLRARPETAITPILLLSAINAPDEKVRGLELGADDYITKPFSMLELVARVQAAVRRSEREGSANPSTRLPGNITIERAISQRISQQTPFAICYCDLDNFKAYNDTYGFLKGDAIIQQTARLLVETVKLHGNPDDFVGHIGGDDFVVLTTPQCAEAIGQEAIARFDAMVPLFYDAPTRERGYIESEDRQGNAARFPMLSISVAAVTNRKKPFSHPGEVAQRSVEPKKQAKWQVGSSFVLAE
ncbi:MAG: response regulator [Chloroflexaceae bacterium]|nr:response regulator [Chloroflexaceae bacterium]